MSNCVFHMMRWRRWCQFIIKCARSSEQLISLYFHYMTFVTDLFFLSSAKERTQADGSSTKPSHLHRLESTGRDLRGIMPIAQHHWFLLSFQRNRSLFCGHIFTKPGVWLVVMLRGCQVMLIIREGIFSVYAEKIKINKTASPLFFLVTNASLLSNKHDIFLSTGSLVIKRWL